MTTLTVWQVAPGLLVPSPDVPSGTPVDWELPLGYFGFKNDLTPQSTVVAMVVDHPGCTSSGGGDWLGDPVIACTPWSVTITMRSRETLPRNAGCDGFYLSGEFTKILSRTRNVTSVSEVGTSVASGWASASRRRSSNVATPRPQLGWLSIWARCSRPLKST